MSLKETISYLEESVDELECEKLRLESAVSELMYSVEQDRAGIIARIASLHTVSTDTNNDRNIVVLERKFSLELKIEELEGCLLDLERGHKESADEHQKLVIDYDNLTCKLEESQLEIQRQGNLVQEKDNYILLLKERSCTTHACQTEAQNYQTRSVSSQTTQNLIKRYPPLRHVYTQTTLDTPPSKPNKISCEVKSLHKRVSSLSRQIDILSETRTHLKSCLEEEQDRSAVLDSQLTETVYKLKVCRVECNSFNSEILVLRQANTSLQESIQSEQSERDSENSALFSRLEARLRSSSDECSRQANTLYKLNRDLQEKRGEVESLKESSLKKEREYKQNIAHKKHLLEGMREQNQKFKSTIQSHEELLRKHTNEIKRLTDANNNISNKSNLLKEHIIRLSEEKGSCSHQLEQANLALSLHTQQLNQSQTECSRKVQLLRAAKTQIDHLSDLFHEEDSITHNTDLERQLAYVTTCVDEYKQTVLSISELVWCKKYNKSGSRCKDILSLSAQEMLEVAKQGVTTVTHVWTESNQYFQIVSLLEKPPPFALRLIELIIGILDL